MVSNLSRIKYIMNWLSSYGREIWTLRNKDTKRLTSVEKEFFGRTAGTHFFDHKRKEEILVELKVEPADEKLRK